MHIPIWGTYITTPSVSEQQAQVNIENTVQNDSAKSQKLMVHTTIYNNKNQAVGQVSNAITLSANSQQVIDQDVTVAKPDFWSPDSPALYVAKTQIISGKEVVDSSTTRFGVRTFINDPKTGFYLNGKPLKIKGVNLHHDAGLVGAAVPKDVWRRRLQSLKDAGVNTIRTAHNPASKEFLELCDEMGFLVQEEAFDEWDNPKDKRKNFNQSGEVDYITQSYNQVFAEWAERDLKAMMLRDRNHASIFQWSIGNEIEWTYPNYVGSTGYWDKKNKVNYYWNAPPYTPAESKAIFDSKEVKGPKLEDTAQRLSKWAKEMDTTRPITANLVVPSVSHFAGYADALDVIGYSYRQAEYEYGHKHFPDKMIIGTENWVQWHEWQAVLDKPYVAGIMVWTGADYMGESNGQWPRKGTDSGMLDFAGFKKPSYHMMKTVWSDEPHLHITTQTMDKSSYKIENGKVVEKEAGSWKKGKWFWRDVNPHWNYENNQQIIVEVYSNQPEVELLLNGKSLGIKKLSDNEDRILKWAVPFSAGKLTARAVGSVIETEIATAGEPAAIKLTSDKTELVNDQYQVSHIVAQLVDKNGNPVYHQEGKITFDVATGLKALGVDNGWSRNVQKHQSDSLTTYRGRALLIVQSTEATGAFAVNVQSSKLKPSKQIIKVTKSKK
ncbi:glycoside hydrolase family 2 TIM barrel-domain containing protein [Catenovulum agarivorans]|uniref:glycoside hydrolase family 2 TIM barrel-domain containing protein n=1 Tax=Catenovulum agarivorans TaxID=1172192 RepID=UPI00190F7F59|nr:glycoside hydrolase family 2 TIM barrel-domain containing protein [Catenovulum agarivorans]